MTRIIIVSMTSPRKLERIAAATKIKIIGLLNWFSNRSSVVDCRFCFRLFAPY